MLPHPRPRALYEALFLVLTAFFTASCSPPGGGPWVLDEAWIREDRGTLFHPTELMEDAEVAEAEVAAWRLGSPAELANWRLHELTLKEVEPFGALLELKGPLPQLERDVDFDAETVSLVQVSLGGLPGVPIYLSWDREGEPPPGKRLLRSTVTKAWAGEVQFDVASLPLWKGRIRTLRIHLPNVGIPRVRIEKIRAVSRPIRRERLAQALEESWKIDLGNEVRTALLAPPDLPRDWKLTLSGESRLRFSYGMPESVPRAVVFRISLLRPAEKSRVLFEDRLENGVDEVAWRERQIDLTELAGKQITLRFETFSEGHLDLSRGVPAWGNPEILHRRRGELPPNVVLVSIDTLRADHLSLYGYDRETSPHLTAWARSHALVFEKVIAASPWTLPSHVSLFTGLDVLGHGVNFADTVPPALTMLAEELHQIGYATAAVTGGGYLNPRYGFAQGFDTYRYALLQHAEHEVRGGVDQALAWLAKTERRPFFLFLHTYEVHSPFRARSPYYDDFASDGSQKGPVTAVSVPISASSLYHHRKRLVRLKGGQTLEEETVDASELPEVRARYDSGIAYMDSEIARLLSYLQTSHLDRDTLFILTSDHGEALGERELAGHAYLYDFNLLVPLIVGLPQGREGGRRISHQVRLIDVAPTVLDFAGRKPGPVDGVSLKTLIDDPDAQFPQEAWSYAASSNYGLSLRLADRLKYIYNDTAWHPARGLEELYDLRADVAEEHSLDQSSSDYERIRRRLLDELDARQRGLEILLSNGATTTFRGTLRGPLFRASQVKSWGDDCSCLHWVQDQHVEYELAPSQSMRLLAIGSVDMSDAVRMTGGLGDGANAPKQDFEESVSTSDLTETWQIEIKDGSWVEVRGAPVPPTTGIRLRWHGEALSRDTADEAPNEQLMEQLKALGYVDG